MAAALAALTQARKARSLHEEEMKLADEEMHRAFQVIDRDKTGDLDIDEMLKALARVNEYDPSAPNADRVRKMVEKAAGTDKKFDFDEYKLFIEKLRMRKNRWKTTVDLPYNDVVAAVYNLKGVQIFIALVILVNFLCIILEKEVDPYPKENQLSHATWYGIDSVCNVIFLIELLVNLYGSFWRPFVANPWNYLDTLVVIVGVFSLCNVTLPSPLDQLKILRAFRILRLFKRIESLNKILVALVRSIPGVMNAFAVMFIFMAIYAVLAVDLFRDFAGRGTYPTIQRYGPADGQWGADGAPFALPYTGDPKARVESVTDVRDNAFTPRGFHYGQEYFGTFSRSLFTLFQVLTGESWSEAVARPLLFGWDEDNAFIVGLFFTSFILLCSIILQNVVVTVLLDNFLSDDTKGEASDKSADADHARKMAGIEPAPAPAPLAASAPAATRNSPAARRDSGARPMGIDEFASLRQQADRMQMEIAGTLEQCQQILGLLPESLGAKSAKS